MSQKSFGEAIAAIKEGKSVAREGWNGKGMAIFQADGGMFNIDGAPMGNLDPHIVMRTAQGTFVPWLASQSDVLANDWTITE